jgi:DNA processing protein
VKWEYALAMTWNIQEIPDHALRLISVDGLGAATLSALISETGGVAEAGEAVLRGETMQLLPVAAMRVLKQKMERIEVDAIRWSADAIEARVVLVTDELFPALLSPLPACPCALWYQGNLNVVHMPSVGVVGSRRCSNYGIQQATTFTTAFSEQGLTVVSGGARGIDGAAHRAALTSNGKTAVVLGSGLSIVYPPEHVSLFKAVVQEGGVVLSEFSCNRSPRPEYFPRRNRIVSGLSSSLLVVEAAKRSGAMITARIAVEEHGRQAYAIPGRIGDSASAGCLQALVDGWVSIAVEPQEIIDETKRAWSRFAAVSSCGARQ